MDTTTPPVEALAPLRAEIERIDIALVQLIAERCRVARTVGRAKQGNGIALIDSEREAGVVRRAAALGRELTLEPETIRQMFWLLIRLARDAQREDS